MNRPRPSASAARRDRALRRLLHARVAVSALAVLLTVLFVQAAARAFPGHAAHATDVRRPARVPATRPVRRASPVAHHAPARHRLARPAAAPPTATTPAPTATTPAPAATTPAPAAPAPVVSGGS